MLGSVPRFFLYHISRSKASYVLSLEGPGILTFNRCSELDCSFTSELQVQVAVWLRSTLWMRTGASGKAPHILGLGEWWACCSDCFTLCLLDIRLIVMVMIELVRLFAIKSWQSRLLFVTLLSDLLLLSNQYWYWILGPRTLKIIVVAGCCELKELWGYTKAGDLLSSQRCIAFLRRTVLHSVTKMIMLICIAESTVWFQLSTDHTKHALYLCVMAPFFP